VPGSILGGYSEGCHSLIQNGAKLVHTLGDILAELPRGLNLEGVLPNKNGVNQL
jgi:predicted Rossmann fold nucleotide-binding protein DprA/Smf involved in DNA uptake